MVPLCAASSPAPKYDGPFAGCELKITGHQFHESHPENIATNLKWFTMDVALVDENNSLVQDKTLPLRATLIFENAATVLKNMEQDEELKLRLDAARMRRDQYLTGEVARGALDGPTRSVQVVVEEVLEIRLKERGHLVEESGARRGRRGAGALAGAGADGSRGRATCSRCCGRCAEVAAAESVPG